MEFDFKIAKELNLPPNTYYHVINGQSIANAPEFASVQSGNQTAYGRHAFRDPFEKKQPSPISQIIDKMGTASAYVYLNRPI